MIHGPMNVKFVEKIKTRILCSVTFFSKMEIINQLCLLSIDYSEVFHSSYSYINKHLSVVQLKGVTSLLLTYLM